MPFYPKIEEMPGISTQIELMNDFETSVDGILEMKFYTNYQIKTLIFYAM